MRTDGFGGFTHSLLLCLRTHHRGHRVSQRIYYLKLNTMKNFILSLFQGYTDLRPTNTTLADLAEQIRTDEQLKAYTDKHRYYLNQRQAKAAANIKATCPCFAVSVHFDGGKRKEHIDGWTHLCLADLHRQPGGLPATGARGPAYAAGLYHHQRGGTARRRADGRRNLPEPAGDGEVCLVESGEWRVESGEF